MKLQSLVVLLAWWAVGCGDLSSDASTSQGDGGKDVGLNDSSSTDGTSTKTGDTGTTDGASSNVDSAFDGGTFACGDALCSPPQICLTPAYGCVAMAPPDGGVCPDGTEYSDASGRCLESPPPPSCVSPPPGAGSFDCSGGEGDADCSTVNVPIPRGCSRVCRESCA